MRKSKSNWKKWLIYAVLVTLLLPNYALASTPVSGDEMENDSKQSGLVAHYSFDGDLTDQTGQVESGKITGKTINDEGGEITFAEGRHGEAAVFDGDSGIRLPNGLISSSKYSVSLWLKPETLTEYTTSFFGARTNNDWISFLPGGNAGKQTGLWAKNGSEKDPEFFDGMIGSKIAVGEWTHVAFTVNNGKVSVYINGQSKYSGQKIADIFNTEDGVFSLGVNYWDVPYKGLMDELLVYNDVALTAKDVEQYYTSGEIPSGDPGKDMVVETLSKAKAIKDNGVYTEESYQKLQAVIEQVEKSLENENQDWAKDISALEEAMKQLEKIIPDPEFKNVSVHDPSIIKDQDTYYAFGSHIEAAKSKDLLKWESFANGYKTPENALYGDLSANLAESFKWAGENDSDSKGGYAVWAPEIFWNEHYVNEDGTKGAYLMYYSASSTYIRSAIGFAVSKDIEGPYKYVDTVVYSGFTKDEAYDEDSEVNKKWTNTNIQTLIDDGVLKGENAAWFNSNGSFNNQTYPNAIDANLFFDEAGKLWMTYGSWSGGIFVLELDPETGLPIHPGKDGKTEDERIIDRYFGTKISGGYGKSGEGPYVVYDPETKYYFLYVTYGWLEANGEYNMRVFRSKNPDGPYVDSLGQNAVLKDSSDHSEIGNKLIGHFLFERKAGDPGTGNGYGYMSSGHNSVYLDRETDEHYLVFHTRFPDRGESHELRIHQMFLNEDDWPVVAPYRYTGEKLEKVKKEEISGDYQFVNHEKDISKHLKKAVTIHLAEDGSISGPVTGKWELKDDYYAHVTIDGQVYKGVFLRQWNELTEKVEMTFTALSNEGKSVWGIKTLERTDEELVEIVKSELNLGNVSEVKEDIELPTKGIRDTKISWETSDVTVVTKEGVVTRPAPGEGDANVTLTATISKGEAVAKKEFTVTVLADTKARLAAHYRFDGDLTEQTGSHQEATITGDRIDKQGGKITFDEGKHGQAAMFDGKSGIRLPDGLISSYQYSVSLWVNPHELTQHTPAFFGAQTDSSWVSLVPDGPVDNETMIWSGQNWYDGNTGLTIPKNEWSHLAFTVDEGELSVYVNGEKKFSKKGFPNIFQTKNGVFGLGVNYWDLPFNGLIDDLLIYNDIAISEKAIQTYVETGEIPKVPVDVSELEKLIENAKGYKKESYTEATFNQLQEAIKTAEQALQKGIDSEADLQKEIKALQTAVDGLKEAEKPAPVSPVFKEASVHDPSVLKVDDTYYVIGSHLAMAKTKDFMSWDKVADGVNSSNPLFEDVTKELAEALEWAESDTLWAGDIIQLVDGKFYMYYNACEGSKPRSAIGIAVADNIEGPYKNVDIFLKSGMWDEESEDGTIYDATVHPNAIDPHTFFDKDGKLWMVYGSYSGGIFILEMDPETGFPLEGQGYGTHLMGGNHSRIEGPYIQYDPSTDYYYLYVTFGGLDSVGGYNMRVARSKNPDGPYEDAEGNKMADVKSDPAKPLFDDESIEPYGVKLMGNYLFKRNAGEPGSGIGTGYVSPGHNSVYYDEETGQQYLIFHARFPQRGEAHEIRVHQLFMNEDDWPVVAPYRYAEEKLETVKKEEVIGNYKFINHGKEITADIKESVNISLNEDGTISGEVTGTWELINDYHATLTIGDSTYKGVFIEQWNPTTKEVNMTFTALSDKGVSVWGSQSGTLSDEEIVENIKSELDLGDTSGVVADLSLPTTGAEGAVIKWESSQPTIITEAGVVTRPSFGEKNATATLTATITKGEVTATKTFTIIVLAEKEGKLVAHYSFNGDLKDQTGNVKEGTVTGDRIHNTGGDITFSEGINGKAAIFDGASGILLPKGLITENQYTISLWLKPEELTQYTTTFFGARDEDNWVSLVPFGPDPGETMVWSGETWFDGKTGTQIPVDKWSHIAFTVKNGQIDIYVNGENKFSATGFPNVFTTQNGTFALGVNYWDIPFKGLMDELRIYDNLALSEKEIIKLYEEDQQQGNKPDPEPEINTTALEEAIAQAKLIKNDDGKYTKDSFKSLEKAINDAEKVLKKATSQKEVDSAVTSLQSAIEGLKEVEVVNTKALEEAIAQAKSIKNDDGKYTKDSFKSLEKAINDAEKVLKKATSQKEVNSAVTSLQSAIEGLKEVEVIDTTALEEAIAQAKLIKNDDGKYTKDSFKSLEKAINDAEKVLKKATSQKDVNSAVTSLQSAIFQLELVLEDLKVISDLDDIKVTEEGVYEVTPANSFTIKKEVLEKITEKDASILLTNGKVSAKVPVSLLKLGEDITFEFAAVSEKIENKYNDAVSMLYDFTIMANGKSLDEFAEPITLTFEVDKGKVANWNLLRVFYIDGDGVKQEEIDPTSIDEDKGRVVAEISHFSIYGVFETVIDLTELEDLIAEAKTHKNEDTQYTAESFKALEKAIDDAEKVLKNPASQDEVDLAVKSLQSAIEGLKEVEVIDTTALEKAIAQAKAINNGDGKYTKDSFNTLEKAIENAEKVLKNPASQDEVDSAVKLLQSAIEGLKEVEVIDTTALEKAIAQAKAINNGDGKYTKDSFNTLEKAIENAEKVLKNPASQDEVDLAVKSLQSAIEGLKEVEVIDTTALEEAIAQAKLIKNDDGKYTKDSFKSLEKAIKDAEKVLKKPASREAVDAAKNALELAIKGLVDNGSDQEKTPTKDEDQLDQGASDQDEKSNNQNNKLPRTATMTFNLLLVGLLLLSIGVFYRNYTKRKS